MRRLVVALITVVPAVAAAQLDGSLVPIRPVLDCATFLDDLTAEERQAWDAMWSQQEVEYRTERLSEIRAEEAAATAPDRTDGAVAQLLRTYTGLLARHSGEPAAVDHLNHLIDRVASTVSTPGDPARAALFEARFEQARLTYSEGPPARALDRIDQATGWDAEPDGRLAYMIGAVVLKAFDAAPASDEWLSAYAGPLWIAADHFERARNIGLRRADNALARVGSHFPTAADLAVHGVTAGDPVRVRIYGRDWVTVARASDEAR